MDAATEPSLRELQRVFELQKDAVRSAPYPDLDERIDWLNRLEALLVANRTTFSEALDKDFGAHPAVVTDLYETGGVIGRVRYFRRSLASWLEDQPIKLSAGVHGSSSAAKSILPKGVVGNIAPWNFPVECALVMVADMLAAGNRVILKCARQAPATAEAVAMAISEHFPEDVLTTVSGGAELTERFPYMPWDHLTYTGSPAVGRVIMRAAAENLTPVTLELGGKNPTVFTGDAIEDDIIRLFLEARMLKCGQVCTSPDYAMVPRDRMKEWIDRATKIWSDMYPNYVGHPDATGIISQTHYDRITGYLDEARDREVPVLSLNGESPDETKRQIPLHFVIEPPKDLKCMQEEVFGPVTCVLGYDGIDEAIGRINDGPSPLASYLATGNDAVADRFIREVRSGGVGINNFGSQAGHPAIPFGGIGTSGMGCHSGYEGFLNYSHVKGVFRGAPDSLVTKSMRMPYGKNAQKLVDAMFT